MKKILLFIFDILCFISVFSQIHYSDFINKVQNYQKNVKITHNKDIFADVLDANTFNISDYMSIFDSIKVVDKKYTIDCFYWDNFFDGKPCLYVKTKNFNLIKFANKNADIIHLKGKERENYVHNRIGYFLQDSLHKAYRNIEPNNNAMGYLQYLFFYELGENFALKWHAANKSKQVIADSLMMKKIIVKYLSYYENLNISDEYDAMPMFEVNDTAHLKELSTIDFTPQVRFEDGLCYITLYEIETHRGIYRRTYQIQKKHPFSIYLKDEDKLLSIRRNFIY
jgi:hypothetical protein